MLHEGSTQFGEIKNDNCPFRNLIFFRHIDFIFLSDPLPCHLSICRFLLFSFFQKLSPHLLCNILAANSNKLTFQTRQLCLFSSSKKELFQSNDLYCSETGPLKKHFCFVFRKILHNSDGEGNVEIRLLIVRRRKKQK